MQSELTAQGWSWQQYDGFIALVGGLWERERDGAFQLGFLATGDHANRNGFVHGGMIMTFADRSLGMTARRDTDVIRTATVQLSMQFIAPMRVGTFAVIEPKVLRSTKSLAFISGTIHVNDELIAKADGVWKLTRRSGGAA